MGMSAGGKKRGTMCENQKGRKSVCDRRGTHRQSTVAPLMIADDEDEVKAEDLEELEGRIIGFAKEIEDKDSNKSQIKELLEVSKGADAESLALAMQIIKLQEQ